MLAAISPRTGAWTGYESRMNKLLYSLTESEFLLIRETELPAIAELDEDALLELHRRIRRARNKYVGLYRRKGASKVSAKGGRGAARSANERNGAKAEIFEGALARVSKQLGAGRTAQRPRAQAGAAGPGAAGRLVSAAAG